MAKDNWIQGVTKEMDRKGTTGAFTKQAKRHDMSVHDFATKVKNNPEDYSKRTRERASLALTFEKIAKDRKRKYGHGGRTQGYADKQDESLGMRRGKQSSKTQDMRARREDSYGKWGKRDSEHRKTSMEHGGHTQGYNDKLNESLAMRTGTGKTQSYKDRRDESKAGNEHFGRRPYASVGTMDTDDRINKTRDDILQKGWQMENGGTFAKGGEIHGEVSVKDLESTRVKDLMKKHNVKIKSREDVERAGEGFGQSTDIDYVVLKGNNKDLTIVGKALDLVDKDGKAWSDYAKGGTLSEKAVKKNYIRRDRYDKLKKEKDAKINELKDANKDKVADLKKDLKDKGADCYDDIKTMKKDIGKTVAKRIDQVEKQKGKECDEAIDLQSRGCDSQLEEMAELGSSIQGSMRKRTEKEKTESLILGGIGGLLLGMFFIK
jgi:hypothetical protein